MCIRDRQPCVFVFSCFGLDGWCQTVFSCFGALRSLAAAVCQAAVGPCQIAVLPPVGPLSLSLITASFLHGAHHLAVLLVEGVGHAGVLLEVNLGDQLDIQRPGAWCRENSYCKIGNKDNGQKKLETYF